MTRTQSGFAKPSNEQVSSSWLNVRHPLYGDRRQELVLIGVDLSEAELHAKLDACLLTGDALIRGPLAWQSLPDPFPSWPPATR